MNLVETIKGMQKYVQSYKANNKRLMRAKEEQYDFNVKLMQSLDQIEKNMDKDTNTSRSRIHGSHDEKISVGKHSFRRACSSSSPSHVKNHKKRTVVDEM